MMLPLLRCRTPIYLNILVFFFSSVSASPVLPTPVGDERNATKDVESPSEYQGVFWQITDIHWDQQYSVFGDETKMCHRNYSSEDGNNGIYGNYLCDSPWALVKNTIRTMVDIEQMPDFVLWTGDNAPHVNDPEPDFTVIFRTVNNITTELRTAFPESVPILPVLGNHDAFPKDNYPIAGEKFYGQYLTKGGWSLVLQKDAQEDFKKGGFYKYILPSGVHVMVLNTNLYYAPNRLLQNVSDPCGQFAWMREGLKAARDQNFKVIIAAHAPPGYFERYAVIPFFSADYNDVYVDLLNEFGDVLMGQIYGHEHTDSFKLFTTADDTVKSVAFLAPSVTPWYPAPVPGGTAINPSLRLFLYNSTTLIDYTQYHLNLTKANSQAPNYGGKHRNFYDNKQGILHVEPQWEEFYQARKMYGLSSLDVEEMAELYNKLVQDDDLFQAYYLLNSAGYSHGNCNATCKRNQLCAIANIKIEDLNTCMGYNHTEGEIKHKHPKSKHPYHKIQYVFEDGFPVSVGVPHGSGAPYFLVILLLLGMSLMIVLTVSLAVMLVKTVLSRHQRFRREGSGIHVSDLNIGLRPKGYKPF